MNISTCFVIFSYISHDELLEHFIEVLLHTDLLARLGQSEFKS